VKNKLIVALVLVLSAQIVQPNLVLADDTLMGAGAQIQVNSPKADEPTTHAPVLVSSTPVTHQDILKGVCEENGYGEDCAKHLFGMEMQESRGLATAVGDYVHGKPLALGYFQIHYKQHADTLAKVAVAQGVADIQTCAQDLRCSATWTLNYLESNSYPKYVKYAIQCHNGCNANNGYVDAVQYYIRNFWDKPIMINQTIEVALK
jgi:hypothetical protein